MKVLRLAGQPRELSVDLLPVAFGEVVVGRLQRANVAQPEFLGQPVLINPVMAFDSPLGLRRISRDELSALFLPGFAEGR